MPTIAEMKQAHADFKGARKAVRTLSRQERLRVASMAQDALKRRKPCADTHKAASVVWWDVCDRAKEEPKAAAAIRRYRDDSPDMRWLDANQDKVAHILYACGYPMHVAYERSRDNIRFRAAKKTKRTACWAYMVG